MRHYHVLCGLRGCYMPETNDVADTWAEAVAQAAVEAEAWSEAHEIPAVKHADDYYTIGQFSVEIHSCDATGCEVNHD